MTTDDGSSRSQSETHMDVRQEVVKADSDLVCGSFNRGPVRWLIDWNYPGAAYPKVWRRVEDDPDLKPQAERDKLIFDMGYEPTPEYIKETYGDGWEKREIAAPAAVQPGQQPAAPGGGDVEDGNFAERCPGCGAAKFAEGSPPRDAADDIGDNLATAAAEAMDEMIDQIRTLVVEATDMADLSERLLQLFPEISTKYLGTALAQALALAELQGRADIVDRS